VVVGPALVRVEKMATMVFLQPEHQEKVFWFFVPQLVELQVHFDLLAQ
jgi:hypothetical protein